MHQFTTNGWIWIECSSAMITFSCDALIQVQYCTFNACVKYIFKNMVDLASNLISLLSLHFGQVYVN